MSSTDPPTDAAVDAIRRVSQVYDPIVVLRANGEMLLVVRVGMKNTQRFMILSATGEPAWKHEPLSSDLAIKLSAALPTLDRHEFLDDDMTEQLGWMDRIAARLVTDACRLVGVPCLPV